MARTARMGHRWVYKTVAVVLWIALIGSSVSLLAHGFWHDEAVTVASYVRGGPRWIFSPERFTINNHLLFSLLSWVTREGLGPTEVATRLPSVMPALIGVAVLFIWVRHSYGAVASSTFLFLATTSAFFIDLATQARGYGLGLLGMALMAIGSMEMLRNRSSASPQVFFIGYLVGAATLAITAVAGISLVVWLAWRLPSRRRQLAAAWVTATAVLAVWYGPFAAGLITGAAQDYSTPLPAHAALTRWPSDLLASTYGSLERGFAIWGDQWSEPLAITSIGFVLGAVVYGLVVNPAGQRLLGATMMIPVVATYAVVTVIRAGTAPRFFSFLLLPLLVALAVSTSGTAKHLVRRAGKIRWVAAGLTAIVAGHLLLGALGSVRVMAAYPYEAFADVASLVNGIDGDSRIISQSVRPVGLQLYIERKIELQSAEAIQRVVCAGPSDTIVINHPLHTQELDPSCGGLVEGNWRVVRFPQRGRGGHIDVFLSSD